MKDSFSKIHERVKFCAQLEETSIRCPNLIKILWHFVCPLMGPPGILGVLVLWASTLFYMYNLSPKSSFALLLNVQNPNVESEHNGLEVNKPFSCFILAPNAYSLFLARYHLVCGR